jgi:hypothetical protein
MKSSIQHSRWVAQRVPPNGPGFAGEARVLRGPRSASIQWSEPDPRSVRDDRHWAPRVVQHGMNDRART